MTYHTPKLNEYGDIDVDYYTQLARQQRSEYIAHMIARMAGSLKAKIKSFFQVKLPKLTTSH